MEHNRILYIIGAGRSGTTLLDIILGNAENTFSLGEIIRFPELKACPHGMDSQTENYQFWKNIEKEMGMANMDFVDHDQFLGISKDLEYHRNFLKYFFSFFLPESKSIKYGSYWDRLFDAVFKNSGKKILIDSSKYPLRALALNKFCRHRIDFIYLLRDPADVVRSFAKKEVEQPAKFFISANIYYFAINLLARFVISRIKNAGVVSISYNDLINKPEATLHKIEKVLDLNLSIPIQIIINNGDLQVGKLFEGNRIRLNKTLKLKPEKKSDQKKNIKDQISYLVNFFLWKNLPEKRR